MADQIVEPTIVNPELQAAEEVVEVLEIEDDQVNAILVVSENGELIEEATEEDNLEAESEEEGEEELPEQNESDDAGDEEGARGEDEEKPED